MGSEAWGRGRGSHAGDLTAEGTQLMALGAGDALSRVGCLHSKKRAELFIHWGEQLPGYQVIAWTVCLVACGCESSFQGASCTIFSVPSFFRTLIQWNSRKLWHLVMVLLWVNQECPWTHIWVFPAIVNLGSIVIISFWKRLHNHRS